MHTTTLSQHGGIAGRRRPHYGHMQPMSLSCGSRTAAWDQNNRPTPLAECALSRLACCASSGGAHLAAPGSSGTGMARHTLLRGTPRARPSLGAQTPRLGCSSETRTAFRPHSPIPTAPLTMCACVGTNELTHLFGHTQRPQDCKPTPRERRLQFTDEGLQNRSAAAVRAYSTSNSTYGSGRSFDEYPPRHLATTARWDSPRAMCKFTVWCRAAQPADWQAGRERRAACMEHAISGAWEKMLLGLSVLGSTYRSGRSSSRASSRQSQVLCMGVVVVVV
jgi:hypothetical protein